MDDEAFGDRKLRRQIASKPVRAKVCTAGFAESFYAPAGDIPAVKRNGAAELCRAALVYKACHREFEGFKSVPA